MAAPCKHCLMTVTVVIKIMTWISLYSTISHMLLLQLMLLLLLLSSNMALLPVQTSVSSKNLLFGDLFPLFDDVCCCSCDVGALSSTSSLLLLFSSKYPAQLPHSPSAPHPMHEWRKSLFINMTIKLISKLGAGGRGCKEKNLWGLFLKFDTHHTVLEFRGIYFSIIISICIAIKESGE